MSWSWSRRGLQQRSHHLLIGSFHHYALLWAWMFLLFRSAKSAIAKFTVTVKLIETICVADFGIFNVCLIRIYFASKYSKKLWIFESESYGYSFLCLPDLSYKFSPTPHIVFWLPVWAVGCILQIMFRQYNPNCWNDNSCRQWFLALSKHVTLIIRIQ